MGIGTIIGFIFSPAGKIGLIALAVLSAVAFIDRRATYRERDRCQAAVIQSKLNAAKADLEAEISARAVDQATNARLATEKQQADNDNAKLKSDIEKLPVADRCIITPDRARRMR